LESYIKFISGNKKIFLNDIQIRTFIKIIIISIIILSIYLLFKSNYIFNLETSTQLSSFFGNELLWGRKSSINNLESHLKYWNDLDNFKEITEYIRGEKFTLVASPVKC